MACCRKRGWSNCLRSTSCQRYERIKRRRSSSHRTKYQESVNGNVVEKCETVPETRRLTRVSAIGLATFTRVSVAADTTEPGHFFTWFRQVSVEGNVWFRKRNFVLTCAETRGNVPEIWIVKISVDVIGPKRSRKYMVMLRKHVFFLALRFLSGSFSTRYSWSSFVITGQLNTLWLCYFF